MGPFVLIAVTTVMMVAMSASVFALYKKPSPDQAFVVSVPFGETSSPKSSLQVTTGAVFKAPFLHRLDTLDLSVQSISRSYRGDEALTCQDGTEVEAGVTYLVKVERADEAMRQVARDVGCDRAGDPEVLEELLNSRLDNALQTVVGDLEAQTVERQPDEVRQRLLGKAQHLTSGYVLEDATLDTIDIVD